MALLKDSLIAHYKLNDNLVTDVILDETGNHNGAVKDAGGTATSAFHSVAGKINKAQEFDGTDDYIEIPHHADFSPVLTPFSISAWVNMDDATNFTIISKGLPETGEWVFGLNIIKNLEFVFWDESEDAFIGRTYFSPLTSYQDQWIHVVGTYDGGILCSGIRLYLNKVQIDDDDVKSNIFVALENLGDVIKIGRASQVPFFATGDIDNVMFFNKELTALDVKLLYNSGAGVESIPIGIYPSKTGQRTSSFPEN